MNARRTYLLGCLLLWAATVLGPAGGAAAGVRVEVRGARELGADQIRAIVGGAADSTAMRAALERVEEAYLRRGLLRARVTAAFTAEDSTWVIRVAEGEAATVTSVSVAGTTTRSSDEVLAALALRAGDPYRPEVLQRRIRSLLAQYDDGGQPFAQVWIDSVGYDPERNGVGLKLYIVEGGPREFRNVLVEGLAKTRPELARRISGIRPGEPYRAAVLREAYSRLSASGVFTDVEYPTVKLSPDGYGVDAVLVVQEPERSHTLTTALGYAEAEGEEGRQISGLVDLRLNNIGGTLRNVAAFWSNDGRERVETRIDYRDQFFFGRRISLGVRLHQIGLDTLYTWQSLGLEVARPVGALTLSAGLHGDRNVFSTGTLKRSWRARTSLGVGLRRGGTRGNALSVLVRGTVARKQRVLREGGDETLAQYIAEVETDVVFSLRPVLHVRNALVYRGLESDEDVVPLSERFYIGGAATLRGYKENQFNGRRIATARSEVLLGRNRNENVYLFADVGYVLRETLRADDTVDRDETVRSGYGFGLRTRSRVGNVELSFGVGEKLSLRQTKVHVLLQQSF